MAIKPNLNVNNKENQNQKEIKPLNEIFDILKKINYQTERISKIKGDITQKDIKNISLFEVKNKKNKKKKNNRGGKTKKKWRGTSKKNKNKQEIKKNKIKFGIKKLDDMNTLKEIIKKIVQIISSRK